MGIIKLISNLALDRCPHCSIARPNLSLKSHFNTRSPETKVVQYWKIYSCEACGSVVSARALTSEEGVVESHFQKSETIDNDIPERPREYLKQALASLHAPAGAIMLAASAVDSMLKQKKYAEGGLYSRIDQAVKANLITEDMGKWAHKVRLDANDQRHADEKNDLPKEEDARQVIAFTKALAELLFVLPAKIEKGLKEPGQTVQV